MKQFISALLVLISLSAYADNGFYALFSPHQGQEAFELIYEKVSKANKKVYATIYSWSDKKVLDAMLLALESNVELKLILHPSLAKKKRVVKFVNELESKGAIVKIAKMNMHEKFFIIDDNFLVNSSANLSGGAKNKYSENFIFHTNESADGKKLLEEFGDEFALLWNSAKDITTHGEPNAQPLQIEDKTNLPESGSPVLLSSSMNYTFSKYKTTTSAYKSGKYIRLSRRGGTSNQTWKVTDAVIDHINNAKSNVYLSLNHLNIKAISDALIEAVKRGVDVKLFVDNQEYKRYPNGKEMTPQFVQDWKKLNIEGNKSVPVRVKYYSHAPSPRYWYLNHHKFILVDYDSNDVANSTLISGSHNLSRTAEHNQFDNLVIYKGKDNKRIIDSFANEFKSQWSQNRDAQDKPSVKAYSKLVTPYKNSISLHSNEPISLKWDEVTKLRGELSKIAPGLFKNAYRNRDCRFFSLKNYKFYACPSK